jgi:hypothetical protein
MVSNFANDTDRDGGNNARNSLSCSNEHLRKNLFSSIPIQSSKESKGKHKTDVFNSAVIFASAL